MALRKMDNRPKIFCPPTMTRCIQKINLVYMHASQILTIFCILVVFFFFWQTIQIARIVVRICFQIMIVKDNACVCVLLFIF